MNINKIYLEIRHDEELYKWMANNNYHYIKQYYELTEKELNKIIELWVEGK